MSGPPCATCGAPPDSTYRDGSPSWNHVHDTLRAPAPYYSDELVTLYHGNAADLLPLMSRADVVVMDPPFDKWADTLRVDAETVIAFTTWHHRDKVELLYGKPRVELIWAFDDGRWVSHNLPRITHETILVYGATGSAYVGAITDGVARRKGRGCVGRTEMNDRVYVPHDRKALGSVLSFPRDVSTGVWRKPLPLIARLLEWCGGASVLDPFAGSGTTLVAAKTLGRKAVGIEIDEATCEVAANRCRQETLGLI